VLVFLIPLSYMGSRLFGVRGVFIGRLITDLSVGSIGLFWITHTYGAAVTAAAAQPASVSSSP